MELRVQNVPRIKENVIGIIQKYTINPTKYINLMHGIIEKIRLLTIVVTFAHSYAQHSMQSAVLKNPYMNMYSPNDISIGIHQHLMRYKCSL